MSRDVPMSRDAPVVGALVVAAAIERREGTALRRLRDMNSRELRALQVNLLRVRTLIEQVLDELEEDATTRVQAGQGN